MSDATSTPVDKANEQPIRDEIRRVNGAIESLQHSIGPLFDALAERLAHRLDTDRDAATARLDAFFASVEASRREDAAAVRLMIADVEERNDTAIIAAHLHFEAEIRRLDGRIDDLDLRVGAHVGDDERTREEITGTIKITREIVDGTRRSVDDLNREVGGINAFLATHKKEAGIGAGGVGLGIAVYSAAPHVGGWISGAFEAVKGLFQ